MSLAVRLQALLLAAGFGTRLRPLTDAWPKCLMPIGGKALLEYWLEALWTVGIAEVVVNSHYRADAVEAFLARPRFSCWVNHVHEPKLLGTAGTLRAQAARFQDGVTLVIHADNWCLANLAAFLQYHQVSRPAGCSITMMTFDAELPEACGIVETDERGVVRAFYEKVANPPGRCANGAVYLLEPEVVDWVGAHPEVTDFSTEVLPAWLGRIATWHSDGIHRDIGSISALLKARQDPSPASVWTETDEWQRCFSLQPIHRQLAELETEQPFSVTDAPGW